MKKLLTDLTLYQYLHLVHSKNITSELLDAAQNLDNFEGKDICVSGQMSRYCANRTIMHPYANRFSY